MVDTLALKKILLKLIRKDILEHREEIENWTKENVPNAEIARRLKCKIDTLKRYYSIMGISYKGNMNRKGLKHYEQRLPIEHFLKSNTSNSSKRRRLIEEGVKEAKCENCGLTMWMNKPIPLELHHKDLNHYNNDISNLQILCSNCHMQIHNYNNNTLSAHQETDEVELP